MPVLLEELRQAHVARAQAKRFAEAALSEQDGAMKFYFRNVAMSWNRAAELHEFLADTALQSEQGRTVARANEA